MFGRFLTVTVLLGLMASVASAGRNCASELMLEVDLHSGESTTGSPCVRHGGTVTVTVRNVNPFLYDVGINDQVFRSGTPLPFDAPPLEPPALPVVDRPDAPFRGAVAAYNAGVRRLYFSATELDRRLHQIVYGSPTPDRERARQAVAELLEKRGDDMTEISTEILQVGRKALDRIDGLRQEVLDAFPAAADEREGDILLLVNAAHAVFAGDREAILARFRSASDLVLQLGQARFEAVSAPIVATGEELPIRLSVSLREGLDPERYPVAFEIHDHEVARVQTSRGFTLGASAGLILSSPVDASYSADASGNIARSGNDDAGSAGIGAMIHTYQRKPGDINHGPAVGLGVNDGGGVQYFLGYGVMLGRKHRLIFSTGGTLSDVERLAGGIQVGEPVPSNGVIPTEKKLELGFFVGVSYRFWSAGRRR